MNLAFSVPNNQSFLPGKCAHCLPELDLLPIIIALPSSLSLVQTTLDKEFRHFS